MKLPGFIDSHLHVLGLGYTSFNIDLTKVKSIKEIIELTKLYLNQSIIIGRGWNQTDFEENRMLTKEDLNTISSDIPIVMVRVCGHVITANDKMLSLAGITNESSQIEGGNFNFETGIFSENALGLIYDVMPKHSKEDLERYLIKANQLLLENGITSVASDDFCIFPIPFEDVIEVINRLYSENKIQVKITEQVNLPYNELERFIKKGYVNKSFGKFKMGPLKILSDGSLGGKTAYLFKSYEGEPNNFGINTYKDSELFELVHLANKNNMDVVIHAIGDKAISQSLTALTKSIDLTKRYHHNHAIIHAQLATKEHIEIMAKYKIGAIIQPIFLNSDISIIESRIGNRSNESYLFKTMFDNYINVGFSTDSPIEPLNPFMNMYCAISRKSIKNPDLLPFIATEGFSLKNALSCYTTKNLQYVYEKELNPKDYVIVDRDISESSVEDLLNVKILETYIENKLVFKSEVTWKVTFF